MFKPTAQASKNSEQGDKQAEGALKCTQAAVDPPVVSNGETDSAAHNDHRKRTSCYQSEAGIREVLWQGSVKIQMDRGVTQT